MQGMAAGRDTAPEVQLRRELWRRGLRGYRVDRDLGLPGVRRRADIVWVGRRVAVFVDGCFWHACPEHGTAPKANEDYWSSKLLRNTERDHETDRLAADEDWTVVRVWEHEPAAAAADRVESILNRT